MGNRFRACTPWAKRRASAAEAFTAKDRWKAPSWAAASSPAAWPDNASEPESPPRVAVSRLLNPQGNQNSLHIGRAHVHVRAHGGGVGTLVERLEQRHLGDGVALARVQRTAVAALPILHRGVAHQNGNRDRRLAVRGDVEDMLGPAVAVAFIRPVAFIVILINITALSGIGFLAADCRRAGQRLRFA